MFKNLFLKVSVFRAFTKLVKDPNQTERIFEIGDIALHKIGDVIPPNLKDTVENQDFHQMYRDGYNPKIDLAELRKLPSNSFGGSVAKFLDLNGFEANTFPMVNEKGIVAYLSSRARQTHDLWHVLTGYGTGVPSELALQGFMMAQIGSIIPAMILAGGILHTIIFKPTEIKSTFALIVEGYRRGQVASPLIAVRWEQHWATDLETLRSQYGLNQVAFRSTLFENAQEDYRGRKPDSLIRKLA